MYELFVRRDGERVGQIDTYARLQLVLAFDDVGSWVLDLDRDAAIAAELGAGARLEILRDGSPLLSGPVATLDRNWSAAADELTFGGPSDLVAIAERLAMPRPTAGWGSDEQGVFESPEITFDVRTGAAETVIHAYVDANAGPGARADRQVPGLVLGVDQGRGKEITGRARFQTLLELVRDAGFASGLDLGFALVQSGDELVFEVLEAVDRGLTFADELGDLAAFRLQQAQRPNATAVLIGGATPPGNSRRLYERLDPAGIVSFGRIERFIDRSDSPTAAELAQTDESSFTRPVAITLTPAEVAGVVFDRDYGLGDIVRVVVDGEPITQSIREIRIEQTPAGETVVPVVGTPGATGDPQIFSEVRRLRREVRRAGTLVNVEVSP